MSAYYNEIDPFAAAWLRNLITAGHIAPGEVDDRSIKDVRPADLLGFTQCHFFAGIGVWSFALRNAGWTDDRPVWTGSCPCQPFSVAGKRAGVDDERHLWPTWLDLIKECRPPVVFGEQVASKDGLGWLELVQADMERAGYASGAIDLCAAGVGAPHIRQRLWFVGERVEHTAGDGRQEWRAKPGGRRAEPRCSTSGLADTDEQTSSRRRVFGPGQSDEARNGFALKRSAGLRTDGWLADAGWTSPTTGHWRDADWLFCRDGKWRPVEPGYEQMADGSAASLGRVRARDIEEAEGEINAWAIRHQTDPGEALRRVWRELRAEAICEREVGRFSGVQSPAVLLAFLRQLTEQGWRFADPLACEGAKASQVVVRVLRFDAESARTPLRPELAEQLPGQPTDPLRELSSIVAYHATQCWGDACRAKAGAASFPLGQSAAGRVGRLRAYGNAIVAQAAQAFIEAYLEAA